MFGVTPAPIDLYFFTEADAAGTSHDPKLVITYTDVLTGSASGGLVLGGSVAAKTKHEGSASGGLVLGGTVRAAKDVEPVAGKEYVYRVYQEDGTYIGVWKDVRDNPEFSQRLNTPGTTMSVFLNRSANATTGKRDTLTDDTGDPLITDDGDLVVADYVTRQTVGEDADVLENHNVDIYVHYGSFETLQTDDGHDLITDDGEDILWPLGAPLGRRIFSGFILDYAATYGDRDGVEVTLMSNGAWELANAPIRSGSATTVTYGATDHGQVIRDLLVMNAAWHTAGQIGSGSSTVTNTGQTITPTFRLNTVLDGIEEVHRQSPDGWYWYANVAENEVYFQQRASTPHHTFILGEHIGSLKISKSIEGLKTDLFFVGGDPGSGIYYKKFTHTSTVNRKGLDRQTDRRVWTDATAQKRADKTFGRYGDPIYTTQVTIIAEKYDIESIELGQVVGFANAGNFIDDLQLQIVNLRYSAYSVTLDLGDVLDRQTDIIDETQSTPQDEQYESIPSTPS